MEAEGWLAIATIGLVPLIVAGFFLFGFSLLGGEGEGEGEAEEGSRRALELTD